jgi:hypothetical protein
MHSHAHSISARHASTPRQIRQPVSSISAPRLLLTLLLLLALLLTGLLTFTFALLVAAAAAT